ncbi:porphobilinogen deaminase isoform X1 [Neodiprion pinetum]|uniref:hydroxymethylbilane synthase n=2 Tax=Neodiprion lecontei TaxID=441921 RepID=A0A6J0BDT4_NEOLC|nr:porphobilinogen deaminase isoform X1 [Neodiprion lecontei]XP_046434117.1 porphobilinogen deaminase isoform X1 [Neodiprion fabricii]XP_046492179.1 porphobilinogen deaminase isoform X1 [Neodiprion pinetum]XP_046627631.1 porphobilinogen deaminase isoform X1 [Neodiprion virginianus]
MTSETRDVIRVGSRKSELALIQTRFVIKCLEDIHPKKTFEIVTMSTKGDKILDKSLPKIGEKALFTAELEIALENGRVDFVVHSLKDLPTTLPEGMALGAVLKREDPRDAVVMSKKFLGNTLSSLPEGSVIGTSSLRRSAQLARNMPHLKVESIRGNLNTRLKKLDDESSTFAAIILAAAGMKRMGWEDRISQLLEPEEALYAVGQGALGVECRETDWDILSLLSPLHDIETTLRCVCERSFLRTLGGGCSAPVAVCSSLVEKDLSITGAVWSLNGQTTISSTLKSKIYLPDDDGEPPKKCPYREPRLYCSIVPGKVSGISLYGAEQLGQDIAEQLVSKGALAIMSEARQEVLSTP